MTLADRIVVMRDGEIEQVGTPLDIYGDPSSYFVADFFGSPSMNLMPGEIAPGDDGAVFKNATFTVALPERLAAAPSGAATLGIRPEHIGIGGDGDLERSVHLVEPLGKDTLLYFDYGGERDLIAVVDGVSSYRAGSTLGIRFTPEHLVLFDTHGARIR